MQHQNPDTTVALATSKSSHYGLVHRSQSNHYYFINNFLNQIVLFAAIIHLLQSHMQRENLVATVPFMRPNPSAAFKSNHCCCSVCSLWIQPLSFCQQHIFNLCCSNQDTQIQYLQSAWSTTRVKAKIYDFTSLNVGNFTQSLNVDPNREFEGY